jgi:endonuclease G
MKTETKKPVSVLKKFGDFKSVTAFLDSYRLNEKQTLLDEIAAVETVSGAAKHLSSRLNERAIVKVEGTIVELKGKAPTSKTTGHYLMQVLITKVISKDSRVSPDVDDAYKQQRLILVATRYGDKMGIMEPINELASGSDLSVQGEWITADQSVLHGGAEMSVLHFTHHPIGFICTPKKCYT